MKARACLWLCCFAVAAILEARALRFDEVKLPPDTPKVFSAASAVVGSDIYMFGGWQDSGPSNSLWFLDARTPDNGWKKVDASGSNPSARWGATLVNLGGTIYLFGGFDGKVHKSDLHAFTPGSSKWSKVNPSGTPPPGGLGNRGVATKNGQMWVFSPDPTGRQLSGGYVFDPASKSWTSQKISGSKYHVPSSRWGHALVSDEDTVFLFGGTEHGEKSMIHNSLHQFSINALRWNITEMNDIIANEEYTPEARSGSCAGAIDGNIYIFGGKDFMSSHDDLFKYNIESNIWTKESVAGFAPMPRDSHSCAVVGGKLYIMGGYDGEHVYGDLTIMSP